VTPLSLNHVNALLVTGAFVASLFFNGIDLRFFALTFILLFAALISTAIVMYRQGLQIGNLLIPVTLLLFWLWLGISIVFSPVIYLSTVNFWWIGIFPLTFLIFYFSDNKETLYKYTFALIDYHYISPLHLRLVSTVCATRATPGDIF